MISNCQLIKFIQLLHYSMVSIAFVAPFTLYRPLIALCVYIFIPILFLSYFIFNGKCWFNVLTDGLYDGKPVSADDCPDSNKIENYWLFNKCKQNNIFAPLSLILILSLFILYPPTRYFNIIFKNKFRWYNLIMILLMSGAVIYGIYYKSTLQMTRYPNCN